MTETAKVQTEFTETYRFVSVCIHCGQPMGSMSVDRLKTVAPGRMEKRDVFQVWIDPAHEWGIIYFTPALIINGFSIAHIILDSLDVLCL